jgi:hypothetical protein
MNAETKPCVVGALESFDYDVRATALQLLGCGDDQISAAIDTVLAHPKIREILILLGHLGFAGLLEYYGGWDIESAGWTVSREHALAEDLANIEATLLQSYDGRTESKTEAMKSALAQREAELRMAWDAGTPPPQPARPKLPAGSVPGYAAARAVSVWRQREAAE